MVPIFLLFFWHRSQLHNHSSKCKKAFIKRDYAFLNFDLGRIQLNHNRHMYTNINLPQQYQYIIKRIIIIIIGNNLYGDQSGEFECGYWGLKDSPWDLFQFQSDYHTDDISSEIYKWVLCSNYQLSSSQHCSVHLGYEMPQ